MRPALKWKIFALLLTASLLYGLAVDHRRDIFDLIALPIDLIALAGLLIYAFTRSRPPSRFWRLYTWIFAAWALVVLGVGLVRGMAKGLPPYAIIGAMLIAGAIQYPNWLALYRLGRADHA